MPCPMKFDLAYLDCHTRCGGVREDFDRSLYFRRVSKTFIIWNANGLTLQSRS
jgi:hypothetical protein